MGDLTLESPAFDDGERIPEEYGYTETNVNPPLEIDGVPDDADSLALVVDDPDAKEPAGTVWDHWIVWNVPPETGTIPEAWDPDDATEGTNDYGDHATVARTRRTGNTPTGSNCSPWIRRSTSARTRARPTSSRRRKARPRADASRGNVPGDIVDDSLVRDKRLLLMEIHRSNETR